MWQRAIRRTFKDVLTFIPFVIILLIPLSPIGHVLVFGAIQRFFPDFFPSCFTERRQNLLQLYESTEYSEILLKESFKVRVLLMICQSFEFCQLVFNEMHSMSSFPQGKIVRLSEALVYAVVKLLRKIYAKVNGSSRSSLDGEQ